MWGGGGGMGRRLGSEGTAILPRVRFQDALLRPLRVNRLLRQVSSGLGPAGESGFTMITVVVYSYKNFVTIYFITRRKRIC